MTEDHIQKIRQEPVGSVLPACVLINFPLERHGRDVAMGENM